MHKGDHKQGEHVLRAKINMSSPNMLMRDPVIYRAMDSTTIEQVIVGRYTLCMIGHTESLTI